MPHSLPLYDMRPLAPEHADLLWHNRIMEELTLRQVDRHVRDRVSVEIDQRFVALARTHIQQAFLCLERSIVQQDRITPTTAEVETFANDAEALVEGLLHHV